MSSVKGQSRYGTLIRRFGSDVVDTLHKFKFNEEKFVLETANDNSKMPPPAASSDIECKLREVADYLNNVLTTHAASIVKKVGDRQPSIDTISFDDEIQTLPPHLWNFLFRLSLGIKEGKNFVAKQFMSSSFDWSSHFTEDLYTYSITNTTKRLKRLYMAGSLLLCVNKRCFLPLPLLVSDVIDKYSSSSTDLLTILSRFGITASKDSLLRYQVWAAKKEMGEKKKVLCSSFTIASVDNINKNESYVDVSSAHLAVASMGHLYRLWNFCHCHLLLLPSSTTYYFPQD